MNYTFIQYIIGMILCIVKCMVIWRLYQLTKNYIIIMIQSPFVTVHMHTILVNPTTFNASRIINIMSIDIVIVTFVDVSRYIRTVGHPNPHDTHTRGVGRQTLHTHILLYSHPLLGRCSPLWRTVMAE